MPVFFRCVLLPACLITFLAGITAEISVAGLPVEIRKELAALQKELREVTPLIRKKKTREAAELIQKIDDRLQDLQIDGDEKDRVLTTLRSQLEKARQAVPVSFTRTIAPVLKEHCERCHGSGQAAADLRLDTYSFVAKGGQSGPLLTPGSPQRSLLMARLTAQMPDQRMPKEGTQLPDSQISEFARWISQGASFDGSSRDATLDELAAEAAASTVPGSNLLPESSPDGRTEKSPPGMARNPGLKKNTNSKVVMADGSETVSFKKDIAPFIVNICQNCHSGNMPRGGYAVATFEQLLNDGKTGHTIVPGKPDESYIVDLVLRQQPMKMPQGQAQLKRSQAVALETWIREGAHFDGTDPAAPLRSLVPTAQEIEAARLSAMSEEDHQQKRLEQAVSLWKRVSPRDAGQTVTADHFLFHGNVSEMRLREFSEVAESHIDKLVKRYKPDSDEPLWRGRLIVFVTKDRFEYEEFNTVLMNGRRTPESVSGHLVITANQESAYIAMQDTGTTGTSDTLSATEHLTALIGQAYISRKQPGLPDWLQLGFGLQESTADAGSEYVKSLAPRARKAVSSLDKPVLIFSDDVFPPDEAAAVGYLLVRFLSAKNGRARFEQLMKELTSSSDVAATVQKIWRATPEELANSFLQTGLR